MSIKLSMKINAQSNWKRNVKRSRFNQNIHTSLTEREHITPQIIDLIDKNMLHAYRFNF